MMDMRGRQFFYNQTKSLLLRQKRGLGFEEVIELISSGDYVVRPHANTDLYPHQFIVEVAVNEYVYVVPFVIQSDGNIFFKTIFPSRKATKRRTRSQQS